MLAPLSWAEAVKLTTADGNTLEGEITDWTTRELAVVADGIIRSVASKDLLSIEISDDSENQDESSTWIELADGSQLPFSGLTIQGRTAAVVSPLADTELNIPASQIRAVQFTPAGKKALDRPSTDSTGDFLLIVRKDSSETETLIGVIDAVTAEQVEFTWEGESIPVKMSKVAALGFHQTEGSPKTDSLCVLSLKSGAILQAREVALQGEYLSVTTVGGIDFKVSLSEIVMADYSAGKLTYLSDIEPLKSKWTPLVGLPAAAATIQDYGTPRRDISFTGSALTLTKQIENERTIEAYSKGLAIRSRTELEYRVPRGVLRFAATAGIDPEAADQGHVLLRIEVDGQVAFEEEIDGKKNPTDIDLDVTGSERLKITVDYGENLDTGDRLHLVEARLIK